MYNTDIPNREELPSTAKLIRSTIVAAIVALVLLVTVVMPAEYALDPTGAGRLLGLTEMGEIKDQLAEEAAADAKAEMVAVQSSSAKGPQEVAEPTMAEPAEQSVSAPEAEVTTAEPEPTPGSEAAEPKWQNEVRVVLTPGEGTEFKLTMEEGAVARYSWVSEGGPFNYDTHGNGSGQSISELRQLLKQYKQSKKMVKMFKGAQAEKGMEKMMQKLQKGQMSGRMSRKKMKF